VVTLSKVMKQLRISNKSVVTISDRSPSGKKKKSFFFFLPKRILQETNVDKCRRGRLLRAWLLPTALIHFSVALDFPIFENAPMSATSLNLFRHERKYFCLSPRAVRKVRTVSTTKLKRAPF